MACIRIIYFVIPVACCIVSTPIEETGDLQFRDEETNIVQLPLDNLKTDMTIHAYLAYFIQSESIDRILWDGELFDICEHTDLFDPNHAVDVDRTKVECVKTFTEILKGLLPVLQHSDSGINDIGYGNMVTEIYRL